MGCCEPGNSATPERKRLFLDTEFTGLQQHTTLISLAFCAESGAEFYAEFTDFDRSRTDDWIRDQVLGRTRWVGAEGGATWQGVRHDRNLTECCGNTGDVRTHLRNWLQQFGPVEVWADCLAWDWVLFCELFGGALRVPENIFYIPQELSTLFLLQGRNPDCDREAFAGMAEQPPQQGKHNALYDARVARLCYLKLRSGEPQTGF